MVASLIYLRYSKRRYLKFYRAFDRFKMKCFFHEALTFWGYAARQCIIDNTNLARLRGTGANALIHPEMEAFARQYGFAYRCHALKHSNRKAGEERSFWFVETNFLPGRTFANLEDLNRQAFAVVHRAPGPQAPGQGGTHPRPGLRARAHLPAPGCPRSLPAPYRVHGRGTDEYGFMSFGANYYWVPGTRREDVKVLEYSDRLKIFQAGQCLAEYPLPADGVRSAKFSPPGQPAPPHHPHNRQRPTELEEKHLRALAPAVNAYLDYALPTQRPGAPSVPAPPAGLEPPDERRAIDSNPGARPQISHHRPGNPPEHRLALPPTTEPRPGALGRNGCRTSASARLTRKVR